MAIPFLNNINLSDNQLLNAKLQVTSTAPTAAAGQIYFDSTGADETAKYYSNATDTFVSLKEYTFPAGSFITGTVTGTTPKPIITFDLSAVDGTAGASERYLTKTNKWATVASIPGTYKWTVSDGTNSTDVTSEDLVTFSGTANEIEVAESSRTVTIGLPDDVTISNNLTVLGAGDFTGQVTIPALPIADTDAASKKYVDDNIAGGLIYQGSYNAATNTPDLDSATSIQVNKGWTYTVTVDGLFFTEQVRVGDVLISEIDQAAGASALANWTTVQNNIDLASLTQVGIGNVNAGTGISVAYAAGTATVTNTENNSDNTATGIITAGNLAGTVTHAFGINTIVQTISSSGDTVYCDVTRTATTSVATISVVEATDITILVQKIG